MRQLCEHYLWESFSFSKKTLFLVTARFKQGIMPDGTTVANKTLQQNTCVEHRPHRHLWAAVVGTRLEAWRFAQERPDSCARHLAIPDCCDI